MGIKSLRKNESYYNFFANSGLDAVNREPYVKPYTWGGDRGIFAGGHVSGVGDSNVIGYRDLTTTGNASDFGNTTQARGYMAACSNGTRACWAGKYGASAAIDYVTVSTTGDATDFGDLYQARFYITSTSGDP